VLKFIGLEGIDIILFVLFVCWDFPGLSVFCSPFCKLNVLWNWFLDLQFTTDNLQLTIFIHNKYFHSRESLIDSNQLIKSWKGSAVQLNTIINL